MNWKKNQETLDDQASHPPPKKSDRPSISTTRVLLRGKFTEDVPSAERAYLKILKADGKGEIIDLGSLGVTEAMVGRSPECEIRVAVDSVSRKHARVALRNEEYHIEDMDSTNGVYVNGVRVVKCVLRDNDQIEVGGVKIIFNEEKILKAYDDHG